MPKHTLPGGAASRLLLALLASFMVVGRPVTFAAADLADSAAVAEAVAGATFPAADSLEVGTEPRADARECIEGLVWEPASFTVSLAQPAAGTGDLAVRFPSPRPGGDARNDVVSMEWYQVREPGPWPARPPACVVVHESGSGMQFGRLIARGIREHGIHAFLVHLPHYGERRDPATKPGPEKLVPAVRQAVADVRRARDAVAALPGVDAGRICLQGTSLGGFVATTAASLDRGFAETFIMLAGADLPAVLANGRKDAAKVRDRLAAAGMNDRLVRDTLHAIEPLRLAHRLDPDHTWLYSGRFDDVVPPRNAQLLAEAAGLDERHHVQLAADHYTGVLYLPAVLAQMAERIHGRE
jgi:dienelactone hydrolase